MSKSDIQESSFMHKVTERFRSTGIFRPFQNRNRVEDTDSQSGTEGTKQRTFVQQVERRRLLVIFGLVFIGWICLVVALAMPEWFVLINGGGDVEAHIGYFERCFYTNGTGKNCRNEIIAEVGSPLVMNFFSLLMGLAVVLCAIRRLVWQSPQSSETDLSDTFRRLRTLSLLSGVSATSAIATFTYLYSNFVVPVYPSFVLGWLAAVLLLAGGTVGFCFKNPLSLSPDPESPDPGQ